ncbi:GntR family transcriptional regulator [Mesorhizobium sp. VNQ89]|uniref:GntR family transcriptional regulator n=1 Tax=Mesorhizobium quangtriensis TaxID=3157709 RepID=UPI0032B78AC5
MLDRRAGTGSGSRETAHVRVHAGLKEALMNGDFLPGQRLVVRQIAEKFQTSAMPVREAFRQLVSDEALFDHPNRGVIVPEATVARISDLVRVRCNVEGTAAEWAATTISEAEIDQLVRLNERMHECVTENVMVDYLTFNRRFHFSVYRAARSPVLEQIIEKLWLRAGPFLNVVRPAYVSGLVHHDEIIDALRRADGQAARRALVADLTEAADIVLRAAASPEGLQVQTRPAPRRRRMLTSVKASAK